VRGQLPQKIGTHNSGVGLPQILNKHSAAKPPGARSYNSTKYFAADDILEVA
jgi:hypothetical protein